MKRLLLLGFWALLTNALNAQIIPPPYINYQATLYDVNGPNPNAPYANQSFPAYVNITNELGVLIYQEEHFASTDPNGLVTIKMGDGLYVAGTVSIFNNIPWTVNKYYLTIDFVINGVTSSTAPEQLVTVPYAFHAGTAGNGIASVSDNGNGSLTFTYVDGSSYTSPVLSGLTGPQGPTGPAGPSGASAYEIWLSLGNSGTEADFISSLTGPQGPAGATGAQGPIGLTGATGPQGIQGVAGPQGIQGPAGTNGTNGLDGNGIASTTDNGDGTFTFIYDDGSTFTTSDLTGPQGATGAQGPQGIQGPAGATGPIAPKGFLTLTGTVSGSLNPTTISSGSPFSPLTVPTDEVYNVKFVKQIQSGVPHNHRFYVNGVLMWQNSANDGVTDVWLSPGDIMTQQYGGWGGTNGGYTDQWLISIQIYDTSQVKLETITGTVSGSLNPTTVSSGSPFSPLTVPTDKVYNVKFVKQIQSGVPHNHRFYVNGVLMWQNSANDGVTDVWLSPGDIMTQQYGGWGGTNGGYTDQWLISIIKYENP